MTDWREQLRRLHGDMISHQNRPQSVDKPPHELIERGSIIRLKERPVARWLRVRVTIIERRRNGTVLRLRGVEVDDAWVDLYPSTRWFTPYRFEVLS